MYLFIILIILYHGENSYGETVSVAKVLKDGYINSNLRPLKIDVKPPPEFQANNEFTICFWLYPFRIFGSDGVFAIKPNKESEISFTLMEEDILISTFDCYFNLKMKPGFRKWSNFCLIFSSSVDVFINGFHQFTANCSVSEVLQGSQNFNVTIGRNSQTIVPFSGMIADFRFYFTFLSRAEIKNVIKVLKTSAYYQNVLNVSSSRSSFVVTDTMESKELTKTTDSSVLLYIIGKSTQKYAEKVCKFRRGLLPDLDIHGMETLVELITTFQEKTGRPFNSFWLNKKNSSCLKGTFEVRKSNIRQSIESCNKTKNNYFCVADKNVKYHLIGFLEDNPDFFPVPNEIEVFDSNSKYRLYYESDMFILKDLSENYTLYESERVRIGKLVGRRLWYKPNNYIPKEMTFSGCEYNEFTCSNGECIDNQYLCQYRKVCEDGSDEAFYICEVGIPPNSFYDKAVPPSPDSTNVAINFQLLRLIDIEMENSTMNLFFLCTLSWTDERLGFKFLKPKTSLVVTKEISDKYWHPRVLVKEASDNEESEIPFEGSTISVKASKNPKGKLQVISSYRAKYYKGGEVEIKSEGYYNIFIRCEMNLYFYPFDDQACHCTLQLIREPQLPKIVWEPTKSNVNLSLDFSLSIYDLEDFEFSFPKPDELQITWILSRKYGAYILNTIVPCIIAQLVAIFAFFLPENESFARAFAIAADATVVFNIFTLITNSMPKSDEPKLIDIWMFIHLAISIFVFIGHMLVVATDRAERYAIHDIYDFSFGQMYYRKKDKSKEKKPTNVKEFKEKEKEEKKPFYSFKARKMNRAFFFISFFFYALFLLIFLIAAKGYIDPVLGV